MQLSTRAKGTISVLVLLGLLAFLLIVELGISAGRIHRGVSVNGYDVGGLTELEAVEELDAHAVKLAEYVVTFTTDGLNVHFSPEEVGWGPQSTAAAALAMRIGRDGAPWGALGDRWEAWTDGVNLRWFGSVSSRAIGRLMDEWEAQAEPLGLDIKRKALRRRIKRGIVSWPPSERVLKLPLEQSTR